MFRLLVVLFFQIFFFDVALAQDAPAFVTEDCYLNKNATVKQAGTLAATAENAACIQSYSENKCEEFKKSLPEDEQYKILTCSDADAMGAGSILLSCGAGVADFVVDTVTGVVHLVSQLPYLPGAILRGLGEAGAFLRKCNEDVQFRDSLFESVAPLYTEAERKTLVEGLSCEGLLETVKLESKNALDRIQEKRQMQERIKERQESGLEVPADAVERFALTPGEEEFNKRYMEAADARGAKIKEAISKIWNQVQSQLACYNNAAKVEVACSIIADVAAGVLTGGAISAISKSAKVQKIVSGIAKGVDPGDLSKAGQAGSEVADKTGDAAKATGNAAAGGSTSKGRLVMTESERAAELAKTSKMSKGERIDYASEVIGRPLTDQQKAAVWDAHLMGSDSLKRGGKYTTEDLARKYRHLKQSGFSDSEIDQLMRRGITGEKSVSIDYANDSYMGSRTAKEVLESAGVKPEYNASWTNKTMDQLSGSEAQKVADALTAKGYDAARSKDMPTSQSYFKDAYTVNMGILDTAIKEGRESVADAYMTRAFAFKNAYRGGAKELTTPSLNDDLVKKSVETGYFNKIQERGFESIYDPRLKENLNIYDARSISFHGKKPEDIYMANNRQLQELLTLKALGNSMPYQLPKVPDYLRSLPPAKLNEYILYYRKNMEMIEKEHFIKTK